MRFSNRGTLLDRMAPKSVKNEIEKKQEMVKVKERIGRGHCYDVLVLLRNAGFGKYLGGQVVGIDEGGLVV